MAMTEQTLTGKTAGANAAGGLQGGMDRAESMLREADEATKSATGTSLFHILTLGSIGASLVLFFTGNKKAGIFVGLWPPTFQALKSAIDSKKNEGRKL